MTLLLILRLSTCLQSVQTESLNGDDAWKRLSADRARFGIALHSKPEYRFHASLDVDSALILFPAGVSNRRYMIVQSPRDYRYYFSLQVKERARVVSKWAVPLAKTKSGVKYSGTLATLLSRDPYGMQLDSTDYSEAIAAVKAIKGFAAYQVRGGVLDYWFVRESGEWSDVKHSDIRPDLERWPSSDSPYPISDEERSMGFPLPGEVSYH